MSELKTITMQQLQKQGGKIAKYQQSYIVSQLLLMYGLTTVHDCTYGEGRFYVLCRDALQFLSAGDIRVLNWLVKPDIFIPKPVWKQLDVLRCLNAHYEVVVVDPPFSPWNRGAEKRKHYLPSEGLGTPTRIIRSAINIASELCADYLLLHYNKYDTFKLKLVDGVEYIYTLYGHTNKSYFLLLELL